jgi:hypothetical protein
MELGLSKEIYKVMDAWRRSSSILNARHTYPGDALVLSAAQSRDACAALASAMTSVKKLAGMLGEEPQR